MSRRGSLIHHFDGFEGFGVEMFETCSKIIACSELIECFEADEISHLGQL